jgi:hypothetical protein
VTLKESTLLKAVSAKHKSFCSPVTGNSRQKAEKIALAAQNKQKSLQCDTIHFLIDALQ